MTIGPRLVAATGTLLALAACGQAPSGPDTTGRAATGGATTVPTSPAAVPEQPEDVAAPGGTTRCTASMLRGEIGEVGAAAGNRYATLTVVNGGEQPCTLYGYGALRLIGPGGEPLPTDAVRVPDPAPELVVLAPGAAAEKDLHWGVVPGPGEPVTGPCQATPERLEVIPPDGTEPVPVAWSFGPVCGHGRIEGSAYHAR
ncbi:DUF4232 domain-containing protein [Actinokineospora iranica]|uniref:DUF4232 domain-containing protein n=1 Tax=Actinokineospora iranica TaxID=1271860 RepID=A0A1G6U3G4_9PSEU|nr:DUF4232 domain-containing protein [Actinokineospora iranica]SDD35878.1 Protein of unknown function [Actinokineospora iranica]